jgi:hypothetical protein
MQKVEMKSTSFSFLMIYQWLGQAKFLYFFIFIFIFKENTCHDYGTIIVITFLTSFLSKLLLHRSRGFGKIIPLFPWQGLIIGLWVRQMYFIRLYNRSIGRGSWLLTGIS